MTTVLFVAYGGAHVQMVLPVARLLVRSDWASPIVLALTSAADVVRAAGLPMIQFKDFLEASDDEAVRRGEALLAQMPGATIDRDESIAYLGLSFQELIERVGLEEAERQYALKGRHSFLPVGVLTRILRHVRPDLVVSTSSPRAEHAAFLAARDLGIPSVCLVDSFLGDDAARLGTPGYADAICVLNDAVREVLEAAGANPSSVFCTGNPAFDVLQDPAQLLEGRRLHAAMQWAGKTVVLLAVVTFQSYHPVYGPWPNADLPQRLQAELLRWADQRDDVVLCIRPRPGEEVSIESRGPVLVTGRDWPLPPLLHAVDVVVTLGSTVGLEGYIAGTRVVQVLGTPFDDATPWVRFGIADRAVELGQLVPALEELLNLPRRERARMELAAPQVAEVLRNVLNSAQS